MEINDSGAEVNEMEILRKSVHNLKAALRECEHENQILQQKLLRISKGQQDDDADDFLSSNENGGSRKRKRVGAPYSDHEPLLSEDPPVSELMDQEKDNNTAATHRPILQTADQPLQQQPQEDGVSSSNNDAHICTVSVNDDTWIERAVDDIHHWLFYEGGCLADVRELMQQYSQHVMKLGIPLDRLFIGGFMLHEATAAYVWKWQEDAEFMQQEIPRHIFEAHRDSFSPDEPFRILYDGRADYVRMKASDTYFPPDCQWFVQEKYQDYLALPLKHRGQFGGGVAFSTRCSSGFSEQHIRFFRQSLKALSTVLRLHTNDLVMKVLTDQLYDKVEERTKELEAANKNLEDANKRLQAQSQKQLEHFAAMSHEIRTPLNAIIGLSNLLLDTGDLSGAVLESMRMITTSGDLLLAVVNDVLDYAKLASDSVDIQKEQVDVRDVVETIVKTMQFSRRGKLVTFRCSCAKDVPVWLETDCRRLQQILYNLLSNAQKFSHDGGFVDLFVTMHRGQGDGSKNMIRFVVKDYGKGIVKDDMKTIFEPFNQGSNQDGALYQGTGLGLSITAKLTERLGGAIDVKSEVGKWTEFVLDLPCSDTTGKVGNALHHALLASDLIPGVPENTTAAPKKGFERLRALVVDDNKVNQKMLHRMLTSLSLARVDIAGNGQEAVDMTAGEIYDVVFMDLEMPLMDGIEATRIIKSRTPQTGCSLPRIYFVTAHALRSYETQAKECGGDGYVTKPFTKHVIENLLSALGAGRLPTNADRAPTFPTCDSQVLAGHGPPIEKLKCQENSVVPEPSVKRTMSLPSKKAEVEVLGRRGEPELPEKSEPGNLGPRNKLATSEGKTAYSNLRTLVVDDNVVNQKLLKRILTTLGVKHVDIAGDGKQAVELSAKTQYDIIFMDISMPVMDGIEATRIIKAQNTPNTPKIFMVTAHVTKEYKAQCVKCGGDAFVPKPVTKKTIEDLLVPPKIKPQVESVEGYAPKICPAKPLESHPGQISLVSAMNTIKPILSATNTAAKRMATDNGMTVKQQKIESKPFAELRTLVVDDNVINQKILKRILTTLGVAHVDIASDGQEAVAVSSQKQFDVIFMDIQMPILDGIEATRIIKTRNTSPPDTTPKIFMITAHATKEYEARSKECGGDAFVAKPVKRPTIEKLLHQV